MILSAVDLAELPTLACHILAHLPGEGPARGTFQRILASGERIADGVDTAAHRDQACTLARRFGLAVLDEEPASAFSWDGAVLRARSEASVIVHEIAHWLVAPPERRPILDFGLGAGPETGRVADADAVAAVDDETRQTEETLASLLGVLWEVELGQPGVLAFCEQNWLEGYRRPSAAAHFAACLDRLIAAGLVDFQGRPVPPDGVRMQAA